MNERNLVIWGFLGSLISGFDEFHIYSGLMNHDNNYVMKIFPWWFSPNYFVGGMLFYILFTIICNYNNWNQTPKFDLKRIFCCMILLSTYPLSCYLCYYNQNNLIDDETDSRFLFFNIIAIFVFIIVAKIMEFQERIFSIILYCFYATILGLVFESLNSLAPNSTFYHQPCFGENKHWTCEGFPIAIFWLPQLYFNIALIIPVFHL